MDLSTFEYGDAGFHLRLHRLYFDEFDLALVWNQFGRLKLTEGFTTRAIDVVETPPAPPKPFALELAEIVLARGSLDLAWEAKGFGFRFNEIAGAGEVSIAPGELRIVVESLGSADSAAWTTTDVDRLRPRLSAFPQNAVSQGLKGAVLPLSSVLFQNFRWKQRGVESVLSVVGSDGSKVNVSGAFKFPRGASLRHELTVDVSMHRDTLPILSNQRLSGALAGRLQVQGQGSDISLVASDLEIGHVKLGSLFLSEPEVKHLQVEQQDDTVAVQLDARAEQLTHGPLAADALELSAKAEVSWPDLSLFDVLRGSGARPSLGSLLRATADLSVDRAAARLVRWDKEQLRLAEVRKVHVTAKMPKLSGEIERAEAEGVGHISGTMQGKLDVGFTGISVPTTILIDATNISTAVLQHIKRNENVALPTPRLSGRLGFQVDLSKPSSFAIDSVEAR
jgi:hypothetical protein